jgi:predicted MFS family arabinose efflux permease
MTAATAGEEWRRAWPVVVGAAIGVGLGLSSIHTYSFGVLVKPISESLGWSRGEVTGMHVFIALASVIGAPLVGAVMDRVGARRVALFGIPVAALAYSGFATIGASVPLYYAMTFAIGLLAVATGPIVWTRAISGWFRQARGLALACVLTGTGIYALIGPPVVTWIATEYGWRTAFLSLAAMMTIPWVTTLLLFREPGEARTGSLDPSRAAARAALAGLSLHAALRQRRFWIIGLGLLCGGVGITAMLAHLVPMLTDKGIAPAEAAWVASTFGLAVVAGRLGAGWLLDRYPTGWICAAVMSLAALACLLMLTFDGRSLAIPVTVAVLVGLAGGTEVDLVAYLAAKYFGLASYGKIYGVFFACFSIGAGTAPALAGVMFDRSGHYQGALSLFVVTFTLAAILLGSLGRDPGLDDSPDPH